MRQQVFNNDPARRRTKAAGSKVKVAVTDDNNLVADEPCKTDPARDAHCCDNRRDARTHDVRREDQDDR